MLMTIITYFSGFWGMVELAGTVSSLICVYLAAKHNQWTWTWGAIGVLCFGFLFFKYKLYSDAALQILFYLPMQLWGFTYWRKLANESSNDTVTKSMTKTGLALSVLVVAVMTLFNGYLMFSLTDASFPFADAWTTWMSIFAQVLMIKKYWQAWIFWSVMDVGAIYIYFAKGLFVTSGLYVLFLIIATIGIFKWYRDWKASLPVASEGDRKSDFYNWNRW